MKDDDVDGAYSTRLAEMRNAYSFFCRKETDKVGDTDVKGRAMSKLCLRKDSGGEWADLCGSG
jgi:hypothetical protein